MPHRQIKLRTRRRVHPIRSMALQHQRPPAINRRVPTRPMPRQPRRVSARPISARLRRRRRRRRSNRLPNPLRVWQALCQRSQPTHRRRALRRHPPKHLRRLLWRTRHRPLQPRRRPLLRPQHLKPKLQWLRHLRLRRPLRAHCPPCRPMREAPSRLVPCLNLRWPTIWVSNVRARRRSILRSRNSFRNLSWHAMSKRRP